MNLFIDTNILLSFYHLSSDDLEELKKLIEVLKEKKLRLFLPEQSVDEFRRNRGNKIADALRTMKSQKFNIQYPQMSKDYPEYEELREIQNVFEKQYGELLGKVEEDARKKSLKADEVIEELFELAETTSTSAEILLAARRRKDIGNPPGKKDSLGDPIIWEALLQSVPFGEDLIIVTDDSDYLSSLNHDELNEFLQDEWQHTKNSRIFLYKRLSEFTKEKFPQIKLSVDTEKDSWIRSLAFSPSFYNTHQIIRKLSGYSDFTTEQLNEIVAATISNDQIHSILVDDDVYDFINDAIKDRQKEIDKENLSELLELIGYADNHRES